MPPYIVMVLVIGVGLLAMVAVVVAVGGWLGVVLGIVVFAVCVRAFEDRWD